MNHIKISILIFFASSAVYAIDFCSVQIFQQNSTPYSHYIRETSCPNVIEEGTEFSKKSTDSFSQLMKLMSEKGWKVISNVSSASGSQNTIFIFEKK